MNEEEFQNHHNGFCPRCSQMGNLGQRLVGIRRVYVDEKGKETFVCYVGQCPICGHIQRFGDKLSFYTTKDGSHFNFDYKNWYVFKQLNIKPESFIDAILRNQFTKYIHYNQVEKYS